MQTEILIAGFGGQGVLFAGQLLSYTAMDAGKEVTWIPSYGPEMRGGTANCTVVVADARIGSPVRNRFTHLMAMNQASVDAFSERVKSGGVIVFNQSLVETPPARTDVTRVGVPANQIAAELQAPQAANMAAMGGLAGTLKRISPASLAKGLERVLPSYRHETIALNEAAIRMGIEAVMKAMAHA